MNIRGYNFEAAVLRGRNFVNEKRCFILYIEKALASISLVRAFEVVWTCIIKYV